MNVSKISGMLFAKIGRRVPILRAVQLFGDPIEWVDDTRYLGLTLFKLINWSKHRSGEKESSSYWEHWDLF